MALTLLQHELRRIALNADAVATVPMAEAQAIEAAFWRVFLQDFPAHQTALLDVLPFAIAAISHGQSRPFNKACALFLSVGALAWPRYDAYIREWQDTDPRLPEFKDGELIEDGSYQEAGELLAHRVGMAHLGDRALLRRIDDRIASPYWKFYVVNDGRTPAACLSEAGSVMLGTDPHWLKRPIPCERLFCRCRIRAQADAQ